MRNFLIFTGILIGSFFCIFDGMMSYADTAPLDENFEPEFGIEIISWKLFILKLILYSILGGISGFLCSVIINYFIKRKY